MFWIIQQDLFTHNQRDVLTDALTRLGIEFQLVNVNNYEMTPDLPAHIDATSDIITNGSIMLSKIAVMRGWTPGSFFNDNFDYSIWSKHYQSFLLNAHATFSPLSEAQPLHHPQGFFARPTLDTKTFNGKVFDTKSFLDFQQHSLMGTKGYPNPNTEILIAPVKSMGQEHRHYIVDGEIVTSSRYKLAGKANFSKGADDFVLDVVREAIEQWQPARAFVMDTYISGNEVGIVEIGGVCHAGLYEADVLKLVATLDAMPKIPPTLAESQDSRKSAFSF